MVRMTARFENTQAVADALRQYGERAERAIGQAVQATAIEVRSDIQRRIQRGPKTGRVYVRGSVEHQASAPNEAPATDTGTLVSSISYRMVEALTAEIESRLDHATYLEFGTQSIAPRPSWIPAGESKKPDFVRRVTNAIAGLTR
jgi:hypothetical protein